MSALSGVNVPGELNCRFNKRRSRAMTETVREAKTVAQLVEAVQAAESAAIEVSGKLKGVPSLRLKPGQKLYGATGAAIYFESKSDGVILTTDNSVEGIELHADPERSALYNDTAEKGFGRLTLRRLRMTGCIRLIAAGAATGGHVDARDIHVVEADVRGSEERPAGFGVEVVPGVFTLWNRHTSPNHGISAELLGIAAGRANLPVKGTGVLVGGTIGGGGVSVSILETDRVYSDGGITPFTKPIPLGP